MKGLGIGRVVHYVLLSGKHRPAIVVEVWDKEAGVINLQVFTDSANDGAEMSGNLVWRTSVKYDATGLTPNTWHWPEFVE